jgi:hypothetical protein
MARKWENFFGLNEESSKPEDSKKESSKESSGEGGEGPKKMPEIDITATLVTAVLAGLILMYMMPDIHVDITTTEFINSYVASRQVRSSVRRGYAME